MKTNNALWQIFKYSESSQSKIIFAIACSILNKICDIVPEILIGISIDVIVNQQHSIVAKCGIINPFYQLYLVGAITALLWILESVFEYLYTIAWKNLAYDIQHNIRLKTYSNIQSLNMQYFEDKTTGGLLNILQEDINQLEEFLSQGPNQIIQLTVNIIVMGIIFFYLSPTLALLTLLPIPFIIFIAYFFQNKLAKVYGKVRQVSSDLSSHIANRLQGIITIKSYVTQSYELEKLNTESTIYKLASKEANKVSALYIPIVRMAIMVGFIVALVVGGIYALKGKMPINWYASLVFLTQRFLWPFVSITLITDMYEKSSACATRIINILNKSNPIYNGKQDIAKNIIAGKIKFKDVSFAYSNNLQIFNKINFEIAPKTTVAFVGPTGSGKSSIIKLLLRFYDYTQGSIFIDNYDIKNININDLRNNIALVSQDTYLVEGNISDNISYGTFNASKEDIIKAAKMAQIHDFIMQLPNGYETIIEENGKNFSGGQKQRIAIARAIIKNAPILIFDEATAAVDNETESLIQKSIDQLKANHTIIIIAHRMQAVKNANNIFVLDQGTIVESGKHEELLTHNGTYAKLYKLGIGNEL